MAIGLAAQALIVVRSDGPGETFENAAAQPALKQGFVLFVIGGLATAGLIVWAVWMRPRTPAAWAALIVGVMAVCGFAVAIGSRSRVAVALLALAVIVHYLWRPWRRRELLVALILALTFVSSFLVFRETADRRSLSEAAETAPRHLLDARVIVNDITSFDQVVYATTIYGRERDHENGGFLLDGARSFVPRAIDSDKPEGGDITLREAVWGGSFTGGRPPTAVGDLWIDFGFPGVAVGGLLIGLLARALLGLTSRAGLRPRVPGGPLRDRARDPLHARGRHLLAGARLRVHARPPLRGGGAPVRTPARPLVAGSGSAALVRPALAGLLVLCTFLVAGCSFGGDEVAERVRQPTLLSAAAVAEQPVGSPSRALFAWWRAMQYADTEAAARYYDAALGITAGELDAQLAVATDAFRARPRLMETRDDGANRATVTGAAREPDE